LSVSSARALDAASRQAFGREPLGWVAFRLVAPWFRKSSWSAGGQTSIVREILNREELLAEQKERQRTNPIPSRCSRWAFLAVPWIPQRLCVSASPRARYPRHLGTLLRGRYCVPKPDVKFAERGFPLQPLHLQEAREGLHSGNKISFLPHDFPELLNQDAAL
jgi:hypothetical protein